jgi:lipid-binding SYLF domain-containing protein
MVQHTLRRLLSPAALSLLVIAVPIGRALADDPVREAEGAVAEFKRTDAGMARFFNGASGYAVFPSVGKGGFIVGGARGTGILFEKGKAVGKTSLSQMSVGAQVGGQAYAEVIFFETPASLAQFKRGDFAFSAQMSAVALKSGASANAKYTGGVAVFTQAKGGLMLEMSVGGQKFTYEPLRAS